MSEPLKAATIYFLSYESEESMLFVTGQGNQRSTTRTNMGLRFMCNSSFALDLSESCVGLANAYSKHPRSGSPLILIVELEEWVGSDANKLQGEMDKTIPTICRGISHANSPHEWTMRLLEELKDFGYIDISVPKLTAAEKAARDSYKVQKRQDFKTAEELR